MSPIRLTVAIFAAIALLAAGCGGSTKTANTAAGTSSAPATTGTQSETSSPTSGQPLTRAQLIAISDSICASVNAKLESKPVSSQRQMAAVAPGVESFERKALVELSKLTPPASLADTWRKVLQSMEILANNTAKLAVAAKSSQRTFGKAELALTRSNFKDRTPLLAAARRAGLKQCGELQ